MPVVPVKENWRFERSLRGIWVLRPGADAHFGGNAHFGGSAQTDSPRFLTSPEKCNRRRIEGMQCPRPESLPIWNPCPSLAHVSGYERCGEKSGGVAQSLCCVFGRGRKGPEGKPAERVSGIPRGDNLGEICSFAGLAKWCACDSADAYSCSIPPSRFPPVVNGSPVCNTQKCWPPSVT